LGREGWRTLVTTRAEMHSDRENFYTSCVLTAYEDGRIVATREWNDTTPRDLV
jgi:hypothetical protein